jgi:hypothetical protein
MVLPLICAAKISVSLEDDLYERVRDAAGPTGVSRWLADAAAARLRADALLAVAAEIADATGGPYTEEELSEGSSTICVGSYRHTPQAARQRSPARRESTSREPKPASMVTSSIRRGS